MFRGKIFSFPENSEEEFQDIKFCIGLLKSQKFLFFGLVLSWIHFPDHRVLRTATRRRMFRNINTKDGKEEVVRSYLGLVVHGNSWKLRQKIFDKYPLCLEPGRATIVKYFDKPLEYATESAGEKE